jgi:hypothetical protein
VRRIAARRRGRGLRCSFTLAKKRHVKVLNAWLMRGRRPVAAGSVHHVRGRDHVSLKLKTKRRLRAGRYWLVVQTEERDGKIALRRKRITLR